MHENYDHKSGRLTQRRALCIVSVCAYAIMIWSLHCPYNQPARMNGPCNNTSAKKMLEPMHYARASDLWAFATYCTDNRYELGSRVVLFTALRASQINVSLLLLHTHSLSTSWDRLPVETTKVVIPATRTDAYYRTVMTKLLVFRQTQYKRIVYVESDGLVMKDLSHLFFLPDPIYIPHCRWCGPGFVTNILMVFTPDDALWNRVQRHMHSEKYDMDIVNDELREDITRLSSRYAMLNSLFEDKIPESFYADAFDKIYDRAFFFHFTAVGKPWKVSMSNVEARVQKKLAQPEMIRLFARWNEQLQLTYDASAWKRTSS